LSIIRRLNIRQPTKLVKVESTFSMRLSVIARVWIVVIAAVFLSGQLAYAGCDSDNPLEAGNDCDEDGVMVGDGDCDDDDPDISPDLEEICGDEVDNNCDDEVDEDCSTLPEGAVLSGGGQCSLGLSGTTGSVWTLLTLLVVGRRKECL
jgi:hypothetical protein